MSTSAAAFPRSGLRPFQPVKFGRFTLLAPLAAGGMGEIYLARSTFQGGLEKLCVIKKVLPQLAQDPEFVERFQDEARTLVQLQHGSIAQVYDTGATDGDFWIALEFVDGKDLRRMLQRVRSNGARIPVVLALFITVKVLEALAYAHRKKDESGNELALVHRDVSPQNILVSYEGEVKVIDFGLAKSKLTLGRNQPQAVLGKLYYMPPEQAQGEAVDRRSDLYAVGIVLFELLTGRNPFEEASQEELFELVCNPRIPPLLQIDSSLPAAVCDAVDKALAHEPGARFGTAEQMRAALAACMAELAPDVGPEKLASYLGTLFVDEHQREREIIARFALKAEASGAPFPATRRSPQDETRPIARAKQGSPRPDADESPGGEASEGSFDHGGHLAAATARFDAKPGPGAASDPGVAHLEASTLIGSGLQDVPWDRRASGTRALVSAAAAARSESRPMPWYDPPRSEGDELGRRGTQVEAMPAPDAGAELEARAEVAPPPTSAAATAPPKFVSVAETDTNEIPSAAASENLAKRNREDQAPPAHEEIAPPSSRTGKASFEKVPDAASSPARSRRRVVGFAVTGALLLAGVLAFLKSGPGAPTRRPADPAPAPTPASKEPIVEAEVVADPPGAPPAVAAVPPSSAAAKRPAPPPPVAIEQKPVVQASVAVPRPAASAPPTDEPRLRPEAPSTAAPKASQTTIDRKKALEQKRRSLRTTFEGLLRDHGADRIGGIVIELERAVDTNFDRFIDTPAQYDALERQLGEFEKILDERRRAFR